MWLGREQRYDPRYGILEKLYISVFGMPILGLRIRGRNVFSLIPKDRDYRRILDSGSGTGVLAFELGRRFPDASIVGIDSLEEAVQACRWIARSSGYGNVAFRQGFVEDLTEQDAFDLILCVDLLEHIENDSEVLRVLHRASAPKGFLLVHVPALYRRYPVFKKSPNFDVPSHVRVGYEPEEIRRKVEKSGFSIHRSGFTYGFCETLANNLGYMITRARMQNRVLYSLAFPFLHGLSLLGARARPRELGAGVYVVAEKGNQMRKRTEAG